MSVLIQKGKKETFSQNEIQTMHARTLLPRVYIYTIYTIIYTIKVETIENNSHQSEPPSPLIDGPTPQVPRWWIDENSYF